MTDAREPCEVPGCRNSSGRFIGQGYLCSRHWPMVPKWMKRRRSQLVRLLVKAGRMTVTRTHWTALDWPAHQLMRKAWRLMVKAAIQRAAGL